MKYEKMTFKSWQNKLMKIICCFTFTMVSGISNAETVRILLLGESGAGKSTFLQTLYNSLAGHTYEDVRFLTRMTKPQLGTEYPPAEGSIYSEACPHRLASASAVSIQRLEEIHEEGVLGDQTQSQTGSITKYSFISHLDQRTYEIIDTPGFSSTADPSADERISDAVVQYLADNEVHYAVIVMNGRIVRGDSMSASVNHFRRFFSNTDRDSLERHTVLIGAQLQNMTRITSNFSETIRNTGMFEDLSRVSVACVDSNCLFYPEENLDDDEEYIDRYDGDVRRKKREYENTKDKLRSFFSGRIPDPLRSADFTTKIENQRLEVNSRKDNLDSFEQKLTNFRELVQEEKETKSSKVSKEDCLKTQKALCATMRGQEAYYGTLVDKDCKHRIGRVYFDADHYVTTQITDQESDEKDCDVCHGDGWVHDHYRKPVKCPSRKAHDPVHFCKKCGSLSKSEGFILENVSGRKDCNRCGGKGKEFTGKINKQTEDVYNNKSHENIPEKWNGSPRSMNSDRIINVKSDACIADCPHKDSGLTKTECEELLNFDSDGDVHGHYKDMIELKDGKCRYCDKKVKKETIKAGIRVEDHWVKHNLKRDESEEKKFKDSADAIDIIIAELETAIEELETESTTQTARKATLKEELQSCLEFYRQASIDGSIRPTKEECGIKRTDLNYLIRAEIIED